MKFTSFYRGSELHTGVITDAGVADLYTAGLHCDLRKIIACGDKALGKIPGFIAKSEILAYNSLHFAPVVQPEKIVCVGLNYRAHAAETGAEIPRTPVIFSKFNNALSACGDDVVLPPWLKEYDYEAELVIVVGREAWHVAQEDAQDYIFGYTCGNDVSARDAQHASAQWLIGKSLPGFAPCGPVLVTADSFDPMQPHAITCHRNGKLVQSGKTYDLIFNCRQILSYVSNFIRLAPGDLIFTGTPSGVQLGKRPEEADWLKPGEELRVAIEGIGELTNHTA